MTTNIFSSELIRKYSTPAIPGLLFRLFRNANDWSAIEKIIAASNITDHETVSDNAEDLEQRYTHMPGMDYRQDLLFAEVDEQVIAYSRLAYSQETTGRRIFNSLGRVHPAWRGRGIGRAMLLYNENRGREKAAKMPSEGERVFQVNSAQGEIGAQALYQSLGFRPVRRTYYMVRPNLENIGPIALPEGLEVRPALPEHYHAIWEAAAEAFQDHWGYSQQTESDYENWKASRLFQPHLWKVAWDRGQVAGMVLSFIDDLENQQQHLRRGYTEDISVRKPYRRRGLAYALIQLSLQELKDRGLKDAALWVDTENTTNALRLYERLGYAPVKTYTCYEKPLDNAVFKETS